MDEIAELAPASKPTIYSYFPGKEALFAAVVARVINGLTGFEGYITSRSDRAGQAHEFWVRSLSKDLSKIPSALLVSRLPKPTDFLR